jgi:predicted flap endonuclease-1-like 5' DNA nuclease
MRLDYILYALAIILFVVTIWTVAVPLDQQQVWVVSTLVVGLLFVGLGYTQRPKAPAVAVSQPTTPVPPGPIQQPQTELSQTTAMATAAPEPIESIPLQQEVVQPIAAEPLQTTEELTKVKGIGQKRATQLKALGVTTIAELAKSSPAELATKLNISAKITSKWIQNAKQLGHNP